MEEAGHEQAEPSFFLWVGQEVGDAIAASAGYLGGASARDGRTLWSPPQGDLHEEGVHRRATYSEGRTSLSRRLCAPRIFRRPSASATAQVQDSEDLLGLVYRPAGPLFGSHGAPGEEG